MLTFAFRNLLTRPVRTLLALCGLTVAIAGMVGLFSVAEGITATVSNTFGRIPGVVVMQPGAPIPLFSRLPSSWGEEIRRVPGVRVVHPEIWARAHLIEGKPTISPPRFLFGTSIPEALALERSVYRDAMQEGRFLVPADAGTANAVVSRPIAEEFKKGVGDTLRVDGRLLTIVGIYHCQSIMLDVSILLDERLVREIARVGSESVCSYYIEPRSPQDRDRIIRDVKQLFRGRSPEAWQPMSALITEGGQLGTGTGAGMGSLGEWLSRGLRWCQGLLPVVTTPTAPATRDTRSPVHSPLPASANPEPNTSPAPTDTPVSNPGVTPAGSRTAPFAAPATSSPESPSRPNGPATAASSDMASLAAAPAVETSTLEDSSQPGELPVEVRSADEWAAEFKRFSADLDLFLLIMTSIGVTIAVLGIVNTMLMSVTERIIEFGILKANGWSGFDVARLIALESAILGLTGGVIGASLGWCATQVINARWPTRIHLYASPGLLLFSLGFSTVVGLIGGLYPAIWAGRMLPMQAIRRG